MSIPRLALFLLIPSSCLLQGLAGQSQPGWGWEGAYSVTPPAGHGAFAVDVDGGQDYNGDGHPDLVLGDSALKAVFVHSGLDGSLLLRIDSGLLEFGRSVATTADLNGDSIPDVFVGAPSTTVSGSTLVGSAVACSGADGTVLWQVDGLEPDARLGWDVCSLRDVTGDGVPELVVGIPFSDHSGFVDCGRVEVYSGATGALVQDLTPLIYTANGLTAGFSLAAVGDVDGDGWGDLAIGGPMQSSWTSDGRVILVSGGSWTNLRTYGGWSFGPSFGYDIAGTRDLDGDGVQDLVISQPYNSPGGPGRVFVFNAASPYSEIAQIAPVGASGLLRFGESVDISDDLNGDGLPDLVIGAPTSSLDPGQVYGYSVAMMEGFALFTGTDPKSRLGMKVLAGGDLDGEGHPEIVLCGSSLYQVPSVVGFRPFLELSSVELSSSQGGSVVLEINFPQSAKGLIYRTLASLSGTGPTVAGRIEIPLTLDSLFISTWLGQYPGFASDLNGVLDSRGNASAQIQPGPHMLSSSLVGSHLYLAVIAEWPGAIRFCSFAESIEILP